MGGVDKDYLNKIETRMRVPGGKRIEVQAKSAYLILKQIRAIRFWR